MALNIILGASGSGKTTRCFEEIDKKIKSESDSKMFMLVPEQFTFEGEKKLIDTLGEEVLLRATVINFKRLAHKVFSKVGGAKEKSLDDCGKAMLIYYILNSDRLKFATFGTVAHQKGFAALIGEMIGEFKRYNVTYEDLEEAYEKMSSKPTLRDKLFDLKEIYKAFSNETEGKFLDRDDELNVLMKKLEEYDYIKDSYVWIDEFSFFTPQQMKIIEKLLHLSKDVYITLNYEKLENQNTFYLTETTLNRLQRMAEKNNVPINIEDLDGRGYKFLSKELKHLEENINTISIKPKEEVTNDIEINVAFNSFKEIEIVARDIVKEVREKNIRYKDIAVISRDIDSYTEYIKGIFNQYDIPFFIDKKASTENNNFIVFISSALEIINKNWSYETVFRYLKTYILDIDMEDIDILENYVLCHGIKGKSKWVDKVWDYPVYNEYNPFETDEEFLEKINEIKEKVVAPLRNLLEISKTNDTVKNIGEKLYHFLEEANVKDHIKELVDSYSAEGEIALSEEYSQIWNKVMDILNSFVEVLGEEEMSLNEFVKIFAVGVDHAEVGIIPTALDQVFIGGSDRSKSQDVKRVYLIGCNEGVFPMVSTNEGILNDTEREELNNIGMELGSDTLSKTYEEEFLVYTALTIARESLVISYPVSDLNGKGRRPSRVISKIKRIFPKIIENNYVLNDKFTDKISSPKATFNEMILQIKDCDEEDYPYLRDLYKWYEKSENYNEKLSKMEEYFLYKNDPKVLSKEAINSIYGGDIKASVTQFEKYAACPFAYYVTYGLKAKERRTNEVSYPSIGSLLHEGIDKFCSDAVKNNIDFRDITEEYIEGAVEEIVAKLLEKKENFLFLNTARMRFLVRKLKRVLRRTLKIIVKQLENSDFNPMGFEMKFDKDGELPPMVVSKDGSTIYIVGKVDRVDFYNCDGNTYIRIIDYKLGSMEIDFSKIYNGLQLQLLTYLEAVMESLDKKGEKAVPCGVFYYKMDDPIIEDKEHLTKEEIEDKINESLKLQGLLLKDKEVILAMDNDFEKRKKSIVVNASLTAKGELAKSNSKGQITKEDFNFLREFVKGKLEELCSNVLGGDISITPYKLKEETPCKFCSYKSICHFDDTLEFNNYRVIEEKKKVDEMKGDEHCGKKMD